MKKNFIFSFVILIALASCHYPENVTCDKGGFCFTGVGFSARDFSGATSDAHPAYCLNNMGSYILNSQTVTVASGPYHVIYLAK